ncbi:AMP-binding protein [Corynebacterium ulceribovis]|uniref:AMP-binding protein n=1 Tax=Corynebacterium ulceribovis TaxID=487732 RepID=UPI00035DB53E|nr:AMP-binding protein [Corynebacterium ulceribovis]
MSGRPAPTNLPLWHKLLHLGQSLPKLLSRGVLPPLSPVTTPKIALKMLELGMSQAMMAEMGTIVSPNRLALIDDIGTRTYRELRDDVKAFACALAARGVKPGDQIAIVARNSRGIMYPQVVCGYLGTQMVVLNPYSSGAQLTALLKENPPAVLVADEEFAQDIHTDDSTIRIIGFGNPSGPQEVSLQSLIDEHAPVDLPKRPKALPMIVMSSGTTGMPKGVTIRTPRTPRVLGGIIDRVPWGPNKTLQLTASLFHGWGLLNVNLALSTRSTIILRRYFDAVQSVDDLQQYNVDAIVSAAIFLKEQVAEMDRRGYTKKDIDFVVAAGNILPVHLCEELTEHFGPVVCNFYGSTENNQVAIATGPETAVNPLTVGKPTMGTRVKVLDENGQEVPVGQTGIIHSASNLTFSGYISDRDTPVVNQGLLSTGDLGHFDTEGYLYVHGRSDDMVIRGGENCYPREAEDVLGTLPGVEDVHVSGDQGGQLMAVLTAYVVRESSPAGAALTDQDIKDAVAQNLAQHNIPDHVVWVSELPRNDAGKVVKRKLPGNAAS